ncbi:MAG: EamA family transporter [Anaerovoracaceae bacterium]|nr:EamA family transporter [Anaerovoracaceae bacterium]
MFHYYWPIGLLVISNVFYHITAKSLPEQVNSFFSMAITYLVGAAVSIVLFLILGDGASFSRQLAGLNWTPFVLGLSVVGLEAGAIFMYKAGWEVSVGNIVQAIFVAIVLLIVGVLIYKEALAATKVAGIAVCLVGIYLLNK